MNTFITRKQFNSALRGTANQANRYETLARFSVEQMAGDGHNTDYLSLALAAMASADGSRLLANGQRFLAYVQAHYPAIRAKRADQPVKTSRGTYCPTKLSFGKQPRNIAVDPDGHEYDASAEPARMQSWKTWKKASTGKKTASKLTATALRKLAENAGNGIGAKDNADTIIAALEDLKQAVVVALLQDEGGTKPAPDVQEGTNGTVHSAEHQGPEANAA